VTNYYEILGVSRDAAEAVIRDRFRALARDAHPDRFTDAAKKAEAEARFQVLTEAVNVLTNPQRRKAHDFDLDKGSGGGAFDPAAVAKVYLAKGVKAYREGDLVGAFQQFDLSVHHWGKDAKALHYLALVCSRLPGKARRGVEAVEAALKLDPENGAVHREASRLYLQVGLRTKAERHLQEALDRIPEDGDVQKLANELRPASENKGFLGGLFGRKG
jgi:curved DNA-binding protein CbpA